MFDPKTQFQKFHEKERDEWRNVAAGRTTQMAFSHGLAMMGFLGCSKDEIRGANLFMGIVLGLSEPETTLQEQYPAVPLSDGNVRPA